MVAVAPGRAPACTRFGMVEMVVDSAAPPGGDVDATGGTVVGVVGVVVGAAGWGGSAPGQTPNSSNETPATQGPITEVTLRFRSCLRSDDYT